MYNEYIHSSILNKQYLKLIWLLIQYIEYYMLWIYFVNKFYSILFYWFQIFNNIETTFIDS